MSKKPKAAPKGGAARGRGAASPGRGAASPGRGRGMPPAAPPEVLAPPTEKDIERKRLRDIMDRKVVVWDHMMNTEAEDERRAGLEAFKRLSDDEMAMATRNLSKGKLKEFIDLKIHYFDQLANAREEEKRLEGLRRFRKVGDDEFNLAKMMGPADKLEDIVKARNERDAIDAKKEEKKRIEKLKKQQELPKVTVNMTDPNMTSQMLARQQLMQLAELEKAATENVAQVIHGIPMQPQQEAIARQQQQLMAQAMMPPPVPPMPPTVPPPPGFYPPDFSPFQTGMPGQATYGTVPPQFLQFPQFQQRDPNQSVALDIENKLRLLSQLETTRQGLQAQPVGSHTSMAEEIKENLRKLNHLKMRLIDEILGEKPTGPPFDFTSFPPGQGTTRKPKKDRKIIVELMGPGGPDPEPAAAKSEPPSGGRWNQQPQLDRRFSGTTPSETFIGSVPQPVCPAHTCPAYQHCLAHSARPTQSETYLSQLQSGFNQPPSDQFKPEVIWERPEAKLYAEKSTMVDPPEALKYMNAGVTSDDQQVVREVYKRSFTEEPVCQHDFPETQSPVLGTSPPGFQMMQPNYVPVLPMALMGQRVPYEEPRMRPQHEIGIMANPYEDDPGVASRGTALPSRTGPVISKTTVVVNQPKQDPAVQPKPAAAIKGVTMPQVVRIEASAPDPTGIPYDGGGNRAIHASIERLARSVDEMFDTLSSRTRSRNQARRRSRTRSFDDDDDDEDDEDDDYESRRTSRYSRGRRRPGRRSRDDGDDYDDDLDDEDDISYRSRGRRSSQSRPRSRTKPSEEDDLPSLWGWLCRSLCNMTDVPRSRSDARIVQMGTRIRTLIQSVIRVSREVIEARRAIQQSGLKGADYMNSIFEAENKLWELIDLEAQLANELAYYRRSDLANDDQYFQGLEQAETKIRRLIGVETQLAREIGSWRKQSTLRDRPAQSKSTIYTALSRLPSLPSFPALPSIPFPRFTGSGPQQAAPTATYASTTPQTSATGATSLTTSSSTTPTASATTAAAGSGSSTPSSTTTAGSKKKKQQKKKKKKSKKKKKKSKSKKGSSKKKKKKRSSKSSKKRSSKSSKKRKKRKSKSSKKKKKRRKKKKK